MRASKKGPPKRDSAYSASYALLLTILFGPGEAAEVTKRRRHKEYRVCTRLDPFCRPQARSAWKASLTSTGSRGYTKLGYCVSKECHKVAGWRLLQKSNLASQYGIL
ncbi:hypothetical protein Naga_100005g7 [Nannochloropsis gaditana]|uniref:Secreted protein n=1 Tax=Nannochloropsis gaditana TaxID=72520 RepID=W7TEN7_9STRA|nr:hypothetical protein Naga_100005g7 [Nannochloropsis gaditana]